jgi:hypothetical protein
MFHIELYSFMSIHPLIEDRASLWVRYEQIITWFSNGLSREVRSKRISSLNRDLTGYACEAVINQVILFE